jgi:hypothetical protein
MSLKKKINRMTLINRNYSSKQALGSAEHMTKYGIPEEGKTEKCLTYITAPVLVAFCMLSH